METTEVLLFLFMFSVFIVECVLGRDVCAVMELMSRPTIRVDEFLMSFFHTVFK